MSEGQEDQSTRARSGGHHHSTRSAQEEEEGNTNYSSADQLALGGGGQQQPALLNQLIMMNNRSQAPNFNAVDSIPILMQLLPSPQFSGLQQAPPSLNQQDFATAAASLWQQQLATASFVQNPTAASILQSIQLQRDILAAQEAQRQRDAPHQGFLEHHQHPHRPHLQGSDHNIMNDAVASSVSPRAIKDRPHDFDARVLASTTKKEKKGGLIAGGKKSLDDKSSSILRLPCPARGMQGTHKSTVSSSQLPYILCGVRIIYFCI
jgi:hypothetical protein